MVKAAIDVLKVKGQYMAANLNTDLNLNPLIERALDNPYGVATAIAVVILLFFSIFRSGILGGIREHQEYKARKIKEEIKDQEALLEDESFKKYRHQIKYHLDVVKLNKLLKYSHHDKDLLEYILSCKDRRLAILYYDSANFFIEKNTATKKIQLKSFCRNWWIKFLNGLGTIFYFGISLGSLYPTIIVFYKAITTGTSLKTIPFSFVISQFLLFVLCLIFALIVLVPMVRPWKAMKFLELEKIENDQADADAKDAQKVA